MSGLNSPLRVVIAAENALARAGLAALLRDYPELTVVGQCAPGDELDAALDLHLPDVVVCDLGYDPLRAAGRLADMAGQGTAILALVADAAAAAEAGGTLIRAGLRGLLLQDSEPDHLAAALLAVGHGLSVFGPDLIPALAPATPAPEPTIEPLTPREREVLVLLAEGLPNKLIARRLHISEHTVKFHINGLLTKLGVASRTEAVVRATRLGLIAL